ncbi:hypothetical protein Taro_026512 [Colocasia esculenta]|uniref:Uncharacterized protein n=1 Tax=Colocasia esculenta TaxID=4460 RepID=A0A843VBK4_COLES|nr:hypothetical protein [Colocasia esculenta]
MCGQRVRRGQGRRRHGSSKKCRRRTRDAQDVGTTGVRGNAHEEPVTRQTTLQKAQGNTQAHAGSALVWCVRSCERKCINPAKHLPSPPGVRSISRPPPSEASLRRSISLALSSTPLTETIMSSQSSGINTISGVGGAAPPNGVTSDAVSNVINNSAASTYGLGSSVAGGGGSTAAPSKADLKKKESKAWWERIMGRKTGIAG